ncbi:MAG: IS21 family transposase [Actinobacteria bacterium]|nr:IS21 family transposase [Actinomycetota bacterium]
MIPVEVTARIRRLFYAEHWRIGTIATELGVHHTTVVRALNREQLVGAVARRSAASVLDPYKPFIAEVLEKHPRLRATRLHAMLKGRGYPGGVLAVRRYVRSVRPRRVEAYLRLQTLPGEQGQVDWGHFGKVTVGHARRPLVCFVLVLSWSRALYARFALDQSLESFLRGHVEAFEALGGVPRTLLYDNLKSVVLERMGDHVRYHPRLLELAGHYHFAPKPCAPYRGNEKGKVERTIQYLRHAFFAARRFSDVADLNRQLAEWVAGTAHQRPVPGDPVGRTVEAALAEEQPRLLQLPEHPFSCTLVRPITSGKTPYVRFDGNDYSIPHEAVRRPLTLLAEEHRVRIVDGVTELARHDRSYDHRQVVEDPAHIAALAEVKRAAHELRGRDRLRSLCRHAADFLDALARRGHPLLAETRRLLELADRYGAPALDAAIAEALRRGAVSAAAVAHVLDQRTRASSTPPPLPVELSEDPRVRDLHVTPHALDPYDALTTTSQETTDDDDTDDLPR